VNGVRGEGLAYAVKAIHTHTPVLCLRSSATLASPSHPNKVNSLPFISHPRA
jgi:hypothetical protein